MFKQLLVADIVVADISIHNANAFYELGIRHAFRDMRSFLIESKGDEVPFDLKTDRYLAIESKRNALEREEQTDIWVDISVQDSGFDFY